MKSIIKNLHHKFCLLLIALLCFSVLCGCQNKSNPKVSKLGIDFDSLIDSSFDDVIKYLDSSKISYEKYDTDSSNEVYIIKEDLFSHEFLTILEFYSYGDSDTLRLAKYTKQYTKTGSLEDTDRKLALDVLSELRKANGEPPEWSKEDLESIDSITNKAVMWAISDDPSTAKTQLEFFFDDQSDSDTYSISFSNTSKTIYFK